MEAVELWRESLAEEAGVEVVAGAGLVGAGLLMAAFTVLRRRRGFFAWAIPGALIAAGAVLVADTALDSRRERIAETQADIEEQLASLDPIARAQVLKRVGESQLRAVIPGRD